jgi:hypothetical protein
LFTIATHRYVAPIRKLLKKMPKMIDHEEQNFLSKRVKHVELRQTLEQVQVGLASMSNVCVHQFRANVALHAQKYEQLYLFQQSENDVLNRLSKSEILFEHVRMLSEMNQAQSKNQIHSQKLVQEALEHAKQSTMAILAAGPDSQLVVLSNKEAEKTTRTAAAVTEQWIVDESGANYKRAQDTVATMATAVSVVELAIKGIDANVSNATQSVNRALRYGNDVYKRLNASQFKYAETRDHYLVLKEEMTKIERRRQVVMRPWKTQVQRDLNATKLALARARGKESTLKSKLKAVQDLHDFLEARTQKGKALMEDATDDVKDAKDTVEQVQSALDEQWKAKQSMPSLLQLSSSLSSTPSEQEGLSLEDSMMSENGPMLDALKNMLHMKENNGDRYVCFFWCVCCVCVYQQFLWY